MSSRRPPKTIQDKDIARVVQDVYDHLNNDGDTLAQHTTIIQTSSSGSNRPITEGGLATGTQSIPGSAIVKGSILAGMLNKSAQTFSSDIVFSSSDYNTVAWTAGSIQFADGAKYAISAGNTGNMTVLTFIYFDPTESPTTLKITTDFEDITGENAVLLANAEDAPSSDLEPFWVAYNSVNLNVNQLSVNYLSALSANMGDLIAGTVTLTGAGSYFRMGATPPTSATVGTGMWMDYTGLYGLVSNTQVFALTSSGLTIKSSAGTKNVTISSSTNELTFSESGTTNVRIGSAIGEGASPGIEVRSGVFYTISGAGAIGVVIDETQTITPSLTIRPVGGGVGAILAHTTTSSNKTHTFPNVSGTVWTSGNFTDNSPSWDSTTSTVSAGSSNWDTAYSDRLKWDGGSSGLTAATGRTSLGLGTMATQASSDYGTSGDTGSGFWVAGSSGGSPTLNLKQVTIKVAGVSYNVLQADIV